MDLKEKIIDVVIAFGEKNHERKIMTELLPKNWIYKDVDGRAHCKYPAKKDYPKLHNWVKNSAKPEDNWKSHEISILAEACQ